MTSLTQVSDSLPTGLLADFDMFTDCDSDSLDKSHHTDSRYVVEEDVHDFFRVNDTFCFNLLHINARSMKANFQNIET